MRARGHLGPLVTIFSISGAVTQVASRNNLVRPVSGFNAYLGHPTQRRSRIFSEALARCLVRQGIGVDEAQHSQRTTAV